MIGSFAVLAAVNFAPAFHDAPRPVVRLTAQAADEPAGFESRCMRSCAFGGVIVVGFVTAAAFGSPRTFAAVTLPTGAPS